MSRSAEPYALDTNVIIRFVLNDHVELSAKSREIMQAAKDGSIALYLDPIILAEAVYVLGSHYGAPRNRIVESLEAIVKPESTLMPDKQRYLRALDVFAKTNAHFGDACACAAALECCEGRLFSFDRKLSKIDGISRSEHPK
jgi:predicted nucleic acid-binding protein